MKITHLISDFLESELYAEVPVMLTASATILEATESLEIPYNLPISQAIYLAFLQTAFKIVAKFAIRSMYTIEHMNKCFKKSNNLSTRNLQQVLEFYAFGMSSFPQQVFENIAKTSLRCSFGILSAKAALFCCQKKSPEAFITTIFLTVGSTKIISWLNPRLF